MAKFPLERTLPEINMEPNIADKLYMTMYDIIVVKLLPTLPIVVSNIKPSLFLVMNLSIALIAIGLIFSKLQMLSAIKLTIATIICSSLLLNPVGTIYLLNFMQQIFIDGPVEMGTVIVNTIGSALDIDQQITLEPNPDNSTAFGRLWEISLSLAVAVWDSGGMSDIGAFFLGAALFVIAIALLGGQILILGTALIMVSTSIFVSPVFIPMVLFKSTRNMFQSWVGFALGGAFGLIILLTLTGIIFGFMAISFNEVFTINIVTDSFDDIEDVNDMEKISAVILFMLISIKLLPNVALWASSLAGASAAGVSDGLTTLGTSAAQQAGLLTKKTALEAGKQANERVVKPATNQVKRGIGKLSNIARSKLGKNNDSSVDSQKLVQQSKQSALKSDIKDRLKQRSGQRGGKLDQLSAAESRIANFSRQLPSPEKFDVNHTKDRLKQSLNNRNNSDYVRPLSNQSKLDQQINTKRGLKESLPDRGDKIERPPYQQVKRAGEDNLKYDLKQRSANRDKQAERPLTQLSKQNDSTVSSSDIDSKQLGKDESLEQSNHIKNVSVNKGSQSSDSDVNSKSLQNSQSPSEKTVDRNESVRKADNQNDYSSSSDVKKDSYSSNRDTATQGTKKINNTLDGREKSTLGSNKQSSNIDQMNNPSLKSNSRVRLKSKSGSDTSNNDVGNLNRSGNMNKPQTSINNGGQSKQSKRNNSSIGLSANSSGPQSTLSQSQKDNTTDASKHKSTKGSKTPSNQDKKINRNMNMQNLQNQEQSRKKKTDEKKPGTKK